jgi:hypothetical protein
MTNCRTLNIKYSEIKFRSGIELSTHSQNIAECVVHPINTVPSLIMNIKDSFMDLGMTIFKHGIRNHSPFYLK